MNRFFAFTVFAINGAGAFAQAPTNPSDHPYFHTQEAPTPIFWSYEGTTGPAHWGKLSPDFKIADEGHRQSPIELSPMVDEALLPLHLEYQPVKIDIVYNGHTIQENAAGPSVVEVEGQTFALKQFHFHAPSEHTLHGNHFAMEMHLVHKSNDGRIAVLGVLIREGKANPAFESLWSHLPTKENQQRSFDAWIDVRTMLPNDLQYISYSGSLTTPPCLEEVKWMILNEPIELSSEQIEEFTRVINHNNRPVQKRNQREVSRSSLGASK